MSFIQSRVSGRRLGLHQWQTWMAALNSLHLPLLLLDSDGREIHRTAALGTLLAAESTAIQERLVAAVQQVVHEQAGDSRQYRDGHPDRDGPPVADTPPQYLTVKVWTSNGDHYSVRAVDVVGPDCYETAPGQALLLVTVEQGISWFPSEKRLRERYALTRREAEVALLLAQRMPKAEIAEKLSVSVHTTRHHTERVFEKLGIQRRAEVLRILQSSAAGLASLIFASAAKWLLVGHEILDMGFTA